MKESRDYTITLDGNSEVLDKLEFAFIVGKLKVMIDDGNIQTFRVNEIVETKRNPA